MAVSNPEYANPVETLDPEFEQMLYARHAEVESFNDLTQQRGTPIPALFNQFYKFIQNPSTVSVETFKRMVDTDDTIGSGVDFLTTCLAARMGRYTHPSKEITEWVNKQLDMVDGGFFNIVKELLSASWAGFAVAEKVWANTPDGFVLKKVVSLPPASILFEVDRTGDITDDGILQYQRNYNPALAQGGANFMFGFAPAVAQGNPIRPDPYAKLGDLSYPLRTANMYSYLAIRIPRQKCVHYAFDAQGKFGSPYGRALALDTPILTMNGWKTMGTVSVGDVVFDERGRFCNVVAKSEVWKKRPVYRITFNDGSKIDADENHLWKVSSAHDRNWKNPDSIRTTRWLYDASFAPSSKKYRRFAINVAEDLNLPRRSYLIPPYILGQWLGDGHSGAGIITTHVDDAEDLLRLAIKNGYSGASIVKNGSEDNRGRKVVLPGLITQLRVMGLMHNKHIPQDYLMGSAEQRLELLRGLMDSDGTCTKLGYVDKDGYPIRGGYCSFSNTNKDLIDGVAFLVRSLGMVAKIRQKPRYWGDKRLLPTWDVMFTPRAHCVFNFTRKRDRQRLDDTLQSRKQYIKSIERIEDADTVCIEVDSPSHLFLAGKELIPTHNSLLRRAYKFYVMKDAVLQMLAIALDRKGTPLTIIYADPNTTLVDPTKTNGMSAKGKQVGIRADQAAKDGFKTIHNDTYIVLPGKKGQVYDTDFVPQASNAGDFIETLRFCNMSLLRSLLIPSLVFMGGDGTGSFALGQEHAKTFEKTLDGMGSGLEHVLVQQLVKDMIAYNYPRSAWEKDGLGGFGKRDLSQDEIDKEFSMVEKAVTIGAIDMNDLNDLNVVREKAGFEARTELFAKEPPLGMPGGMDGDGEIPGAGTGEPNEQGII